MKFITMIFFLLSFAGFANAEITTFTCKGKNYHVAGENIYAPAKSSSENIFDLVVDSKKQDLYGYPVYITMCFEPISQSCVMGELALSCKCQSNHVNSSITLSRNSGKLSVIQTFYKQQPETIMQGEYMCTKVLKKLF